MSRNLIAVSVVSLAILAAAPANALLHEKKDDSVQAKPPVELRVDQVTPGLYDSMNSAPTTGTNETAIGATSTAENEASSNWLPPS